MEQEIWKKIKNLDNYEASSHGRIKNIKENKILNLSKNNNGYLFFYPKINGKFKKTRVHRIIAETFLNKENFKCMSYEDRNLINFDKLQVNHKDENKTNNRIENLEWCTSSYNINYGDRNIKTKNKLSKKVKQYDLNMNFIKEWDSLIEIQRKMNINIGSIYSNNGKKLINGFYWVY